MINGIFGIEKMSRPFRALLGGWSTQGAALGYVCIALSGQDSQVAG